MSWGEILEKDIKLIQEWPDASGGDDHGHAGSVQGERAEKASDKGSQRAAMDYHNQKSQELRGQGKEMSAEAHRDAARAHENAVNSGHAGYASKSAEARQASYGAHDAERADNARAIISRH